MVMKPELNPTKAPVVFALCSSDDNRYGVHAALELIDIRQHHHSRYEDARRDNHHLEEGFCSQTQKDTSHIFLETVDGMRMRMIVSITSTILRTRERIFNKTLVPLHQWRLSSLGGRILWDNRKLSYYNLRDGVTLQMRLLLMGGARRRGKKSTMTD